MLAPAVGPALEPGLGARSRAAVWRLVPGKQLPPQVVVHREQPPPQVVGLPVRQGLQAPVRGRQAAST
eukprot:3731948-Pyramimonas_sp.AAC.1